MDKHIDGVEVMKYALRGKRISPCRFVVLLLVLMATSSVGLADQTLALKTRKVFIGDGRSVTDATVLVRGGRIAAIGRDVEIPENTRVIQLLDGIITPGLIDANARIENVDLIPASSKAHSQGGLATGWHDEQHEHPAHVEAAKEPDHAGLGTPHAILAPDAEVPPMHVDPLHVGDDHEDDVLPLATGVRSSAVVNEQSSEVVPQIRVLDDLNLHTRDFDRLLRGGVTTVYVSPDAAAVIGARGTVVHTAGPAEDRVLVPAAAVKATIGTDPSYLGSYNRRPSPSSTTMYARRPNSRMGLTWVFRKAFYDAQRRAQGLQAYGADTASVSATGVLQQVLDGEVPLRIQARIQQDILTAIRLAEEFDLPFTLEEATEAYLCLDELKARSVPVIFGPIFETPVGSTMRSFEGRRSRFFTFRALLDAEIPTALSAQELREEDGLARQAMYAIRFGASPDAALRAVTQTPAQLLGLADQIGTVDVGKRADLVVWQGTPFEATSLVKMVLIDGDIVLDRSG
jgi:imidazolonepropionase-like amidohydrolase